MNRIFRKIAVIITIILMMAGLSWAGAVSERPNGIATPYWYSFSSGAKSTYYLEHPTLTANDQVVAEDATQTLTNKTLTGPTITGPTMTNVLLPAEIVTATNVITASEAGKVFYLNSATEFQSTLPALSTVSAGTRFRFIVAAAPSGASYTIITGNSLENKIYGMVEVNGAAVAAVTEDTITFADGAAAIGDWAQLDSDGTNWYLSGQGVAAGAITATQAD